MILACWPGFYLFHPPDRYKGCLVLILAALLGAFILWIALSQGWIAIPRSWLSP